MVIGQILAASRDSPDGLGTDADAQAKRRLYEYIRTCPQAVIATATRDGKPEAARVNIAVTADLEVIFETTSATRKFSNLEDNPSAAFVIGWEDEKTLQYEGIVDRPEGHALERVRPAISHDFRRRHRINIGRATCISGSGPPGSGSAAIIPLVKSKNIVSFFMKPLHHLLGGIGYSVPKGAITTNLSSHELR